MAELVWTQESERWLKDIFDYIALDNIVILGVFHGALAIERYLI